MDGPTTSTGTASTASVTVLFVDVVASTATMTRIGDDAADDLRRWLFEIYHDTVRSNDGTLVKTMGDGAMAVFTSSALRAVNTGTEMVSRAAELVPSSLVRVGIASGDASNEHGDWFGTPVVLASRLCDAAAPSQVLVSTGTRTLVGNRGNLQFADRKPMKLKGFDERVPAFSIGGEGTERKRQIPWMVASGALVAIVALVALLLFLMADVSDTSHDAASNSGSENVAWEKPDYQPVLEDRECAADEVAGDTTVRCSWLTVPVDRSDPTGAQLRLAVNGAPATSAHEEIPPVVLFSSGLSSPSAISARATADVFQLGLRGSKASDSDLSCPEIDDSRFQRVALGSAEANALYEQALDACHQRLVDGGVDLGQYDQLDVSDDLRDLVVALGVEQVDVVTRLNNDAVIALATVRRHPGLIRTLTLLDPLPLGVADPLEQPQSAATLLDRYVDECRAQSTVCDGEPTLQQQVELNRQSLNASPQVVEVADAKGVQRQILVDGERSIRVIRAAISDNQAMPLMASAIRSNDVSAAAAYIALTIEQEGVENGVLTVVNECARSPNLTEAQLKVEAARTTTWGALVDTALPARCRAWGITSPIELQTPVSSDVPTLVLRGWIEQPSIEQWSSALNSLSNRTDVVFPHEGVVSNESGNGCGVDLRLQFLRDPSAPLDVEACTSQDPPIVFVQ